MFIACCSSLISLVNCQLCVRYQQQIMMVLILDDLPSTSLCKPSSHILLSSLIRYHQSVTNQNTAFFVGTNQSSVSVSCEQRLTNHSSDTCSGSLQQTNICNNLHNNQTNSIISSSLPDHQFYYFLIYFVTAQIPMLLL